MWDERLQMISEEKDLEVMLKQSLKQVSNVQQLSKGKQDNGHH